MICGETGPGLDAITKRGGFHVLFFPFVIPSFGFGESSLWIQRTFPGENQDQTVDEACENWNSRVLGAVSVFGGTLQARFWPILGNWCQCGSHGRSTKIRKSRLGALQLTEDQSAEGFVSAHATAETSGCLLRLGVGRSLITRVMQAVSHGNS